MIGIAVTLAACSRSEPAAETKAATVSKELEQGWVARIQRRGTLGVGEPTKFRWAYRDSRLRIDRGGEISEIWNMEKSSRVLLFHGTRTYRVETLTLLREQVARQLRSARLAVGKFSAADQQRMSAETKDMIARLQAKQILPKQAAKVTATGKNDEIMQMSCREFGWHRTRGRDFLVCFAQSSQPAVLPFLEEAQNLTRQLSVDKASELDVLSVVGFPIALARLGLPLRVRHRRHQDSPSSGEWMVEEMVLLEARSIEAEKFDVPAGYQELKDEP